ncbi:hypothetical protein PPACK8108_LOCUS10830 [Phakopsora pachyrhizi]|uniref:Uncharacterized protein n=1 Tax=Phakopsora pachyrhizi TaxID=170000 RepID=A0AAV0B1Y6_PHAPC|nr:hypothetical protein PPACK8108_LOCUS10830 [Phakopsora pachyrhizi]
MYDDDQMATKDSSDNQKRLEDPIPTMMTADLPKSRRVTLQVNQSPTPPRRPALGIVCSNCINQRVMLIRTVRKVEKDYDEVAESGNVAKKGKRNVFRVTKPGFLQPFQQQSQTPP